MDPGTTHVAARHFVLTMFWQQRGTTVRSTNNDENYLNQADFGGNP